MSLSRGDPREFTLGRKIWQINWLLILLLAAISTFGFAMLFSAAGGATDPWALKQVQHFAVGCVIMIVVALVDLRFWLRYAYVIYAIGLLLLGAVELFGEERNNATRWLEFGGRTLQPSEFMKIAVVLALARYFHGLSLESVGRLVYLIPPLLLIAVPAVLVQRQPDLGTAILIGVVGVTIMFLSGVRVWKFAAVAVAVAAVVPFVLRGYQKERILTFLSPERDPLGAGYHILQSKIALGSGGMTGRGFLQGTQSHLNFLPEKHTDFIFTMLAEELGLMGGLCLMALYALVLLYGMAIALRCRNQFGRLLAMGLTMNFFLYLCINIGMVMGVMPVVGVPLPLVSFGGTAMLAVLIGFGFVMCAYIHRDLPISRHGEVPK